MELLFSLSYRGEKQLVGLISPEQHPCRGCVPRVWQEVAVTFGDKQWGGVGVRAVLGFLWRGAAPVAAAGMGAGAPCPNPTRVGVSEG